MRQNRPHSKGRHTHCKTKWPFAVSSPRRTDIGVVPLELDLYNAGRVMGQSCKKHDDPAVLCCVIGQDLSLSAELDGKGGRWYCEMNLHAFQG